MIKYKSENESSWGNYFAQMKWSFIYEPFPLRDPDSGQVYIPDFLVCPNPAFPQRFLVEVKDTQADFTSDVKAKCRFACRTVNLPFMMVHGDPDFVSYTKYMPPKVLQGPLEYHGWVPVYVGGPYIFKTVWSRRPSAVLIEQWCGVEQAQIIKQSQRRMQRLFN